MVFNSYKFFIFFPAVIFVYFIIPRKTRYIWLLITSYYFYMCWNPKYAVLIAASTVVTWLGGLLIDGKGKARAGILHKKQVIFFCFLFNIGILMFFKYSGFLIDNLNFLLEKIQIYPIRSLDVVLPVGISFYTFQALSYIVDVYRGKVKAERNFLKYALFVSFFPQLVAGPIERSESLLTQIKEVEKFRLWDLERVSEGMILMLWGFFQKLVIADRLCIFVNAVYEEYWMYGSVELILATVFFAIQIYCDFGGYSLIAIGSAKIMGFTLMENFNTPYFAESIQEFWRRWHISLSAWFRDYLYIPLGGSRCSRIKRYRNIMITFLVSGLWHGASWNFIMWGGVHGIYQIAGDMLKPVKQKMQEQLHVNTACMSFHLGKMGITFLLTCFAWIFFRMHSLQDAFLFLRYLFLRPDFWVLYDQSLFTIGLDRVQMDILGIALFILLLVDLVRYKTGMTLGAGLKKQNLWFRWSVVLVLLFGILICGVYGPSYHPAEFIYFQF